MSKLSEHQFVGLLRAAKEQLTYCEYIGAYPISVNQKNYFPGKPTDQFYKSVYNICFHDSLLIIGNLLDKDNRVISFWNWPEFVEKKEQELKEMTERFETEGFKQVRDQLVAHVDSGNKNNTFTDSRRRGMIHSDLLKKLIKLINDLIGEFTDYAQNHSTPYSSQVFDTTHATEEIKMVMEQAKPTLTDNYVI